MTVSSSTIFAPLIDQLSDVIYNDQPTAVSLLSAVVVLAMFWAIVFYASGTIVTPLVKGKPWLVAAGERDYEHGGKKMHESLGMAKTKEEFVESFMDNWSWFLTVLFQHLCGGLLCVPALFPGVVGKALDENVAAGLACLGILSEMGWEVEDTVSWLYKRFVLPDGAKKAPNALLVILIVHHSLTSILGVPIILHYRNVRTLHWIVFDLQMAAAVASFIVEYTKLLDVTKANHLRQFQVLTFVALMTMVWTRVVHWLYLCGQFMGIWYADGAWVFLSVGTLVTIVFSLFSWVVCVVPFYQRFRKFLRVSADYQALPAKVDARTRRVSVVALQHAAAEMLVSDLDRELASMFAERQVERRMTMPPSLPTARRRKSSILLRSLPAAELSQAIKRMNL